MTMAVQGYIDATQEIMEQIDGKIDAIFVPCGTGTTQSGLIVGAGNIPVYGISVARSVEHCKKEISALLMHKFQINVLPSSIPYGSKDERINSLCLF